MTAREAILARIRDAVANAPALPEPPRDYRRSMGLTPDAVLARLTQRLEDYHVGVLHASGDEDVAAVAARRLAERGIRSLVVPRDLPQAWRPASPACLEDRALSLRDIEAAEGAMTGSLLAIAESGTVALDGGPGQGPRALTLLPDYHLCVVRVRDVVGLLPEAMPTLQASVAAGRPITFFSGPSATADIELDRVEGVHGPRRLDVILLAG